MIPEVDIRLYDKTKKRKSLNQNTITGMDFEIGKEGGFQNGTLTLSQKWEDLALEGTEYVDLYAFGSRVYRGYVLQPEQEIDSPEKWTLNLYGLMDKLNGYSIRHCYCYGSGVDISQVFTDILAEYVTTSSQIGRAHV